METRKKKTPIDVARVAAILLAANDAAVKAGTEQGEDGGTCNLDACVINTSQWSLRDFNRVQQATGEMIGDRLSSSFWKGCRWLRTTRWGQANLNTRMVNAFRDYCHAQGLTNVYVYSQID